MKGILQNGQLTSNAIHGVDQIRTYSATALAEIFIDYQDNALIIEHPSQ